MRGSLLTARNVPGRKTMPMSEMIRIWVLSRLDALAMVVFTKESVLVKSVAS